MTSWHSSYQRHLSLSAHMLFLVCSLLILMVLFALLRLLLLLYNMDLAAGMGLSDWQHAFITGLRFDLRVIAIICLPLVLGTLLPVTNNARRFYCVWLTLWSSLSVFLGLLELDFYREFHQRLNNLVFQYLKEDPATVMSMLWHGFPVLRYLVGWLVLTLLVFSLFRWIDRRTRFYCEKPTPQRARGLATRLMAFACVFLVDLALARGTFRSGPPLRWGDAFQGESLFANQLALNGVFTLSQAAIQHFSHSGEHAWVGLMPDAEAITLARDMLLTRDDQLIDAETAVIRRITQPPAAGMMPGVRNVVIILMESFAGRFVGALGGPEDITPNFDTLVGEGVLFTRFFSNGTHTHQGMFATMACFPNLPGYEYLMQQPEGAHQFSGLPRLLSARGYRDVYVYNGDFAWDNQFGFFRNQGMTTFIGRDDFIDPVFIDTTWGVSDQDVFDRALEELASMPEDRPFYALVQTLSNHTPYALPDPLPVSSVTGHDEQNEHLTAMRYSDWALGRFFRSARTYPWFNQTLFVIVGDHGFSSPLQLTDIDLLRFYVPMLMIAPGIQVQFGRERATVGTQVDVVPTIMGRFGEPQQHQCWGRDLLSLPSSAPGVGVIKPSGGSQMAAIVEGDLALVLTPGFGSRLYRYHLGSHPQAVAIQNQTVEETMQVQLEAYIQSATQALQNNTAGSGVLNP
ncbi:LTA synthase family protein [Kistimonas asteriae]|uniref:LTA synthase family protein n=1 Tax=Kistimonas asteriae TaxID=517724 RepID=UPI001BA51E65|nr:LTA synthase family protein [Kistimonas asteriae]